MNLNIEPDVVNGKEYYSVRKFAALVHKSEKAVYMLINKGNAVRKLKADFILGHPMIPICELTEFVFTGPGRYPLKDLYRYNEDGLCYPVDDSAITNDVCSLEDRK